jgi:hypothetical protein
MKEAGMPASLTRVKKEPDVTPASFARVKMEPGVTTASFTHVVIVVNRHMPRVGLSWGRLDTGGSGEG